MAEGSEAEANCSKDDSSNTPGGSKKDQSVKNEEQNISVDKSTDEKPMSSEDEDDKGEPSGYKLKGSKGRPRNYRPRRPPSTSSTSSSSDDESTVCDVNKVKSSQMFERNTVKKNTTTVTSAPSEDETSADTSRDTETDHMEPTSPSAMETGSGTSLPTCNEATDDSPASEPLERPYNRHIQYSRQRIFGGLLSDSDSDSDDSDRRRNNRDSPEDANSQRMTEEAIAQEMKRIKELPKPKHHWNFVDQVVQRQIGSRARYQSSVLFSHDYYDSLHVPKRLELMYKMEYHRGCVNALSFNMSGSRLASGSDDFHIAIWDWARKKTVTTFNSHHRNNVFQSKFLPLSGDSHIVSCARDGQVRLAELSSSAEYKSTRKLAKHNGPAHKLATLSTSPHVVLSAGEDAVVLCIDIRQEQSEKIALVKDLDGSSKVSLYSIHAHPANEHQYCVSGHDQYVRVYDRRVSGIPVLKYCPRDLYGASPAPSVTCAVYSCNGDGILASYNDDDIYLFDTSRTEAAEAAHRYSGHRNNATVKGVNFFGPGSKYVVSGSDCGNIFIWHRETEAIVQCMPGDENGVVNVLEPHPHIPILATSGLDDDVKIWVPTSETDPDLPELDQIVKFNLRKRHKDRNDQFTGLDRQMLMVLWNHIRRADHRRRRGTAAENVTSNGADGNDSTLGGSSSDESNESDGSDGQHGIQCATH